MKTTIVMLLGMGLASLGVGCAVGVESEDEQATQEEASVDSSAQAVCRRVCKETCKGHGHTRKCKSVCWTVCRP